MVRTLDDDDLDASDRRLLEDVAQYGWHVIFIEHEEDEEDLPAWAFSIGLFHSYGHPEVVLFGLTRDVMHAIINGVGQQASEGHLVEVDQPCANLLEGVDCTFKTVARRWYAPFLGYAQWYYRGDDFPVLQCVWPDKQQNYPWEAAFKPEWVWAQPMLFKKQPLAARVQLLLDAMDYEEEDR